MTLHPAHTNEMPETPIHGSYEGDVCNRNGCSGHISLEKDGGCSCHISAPCSPCMASYMTCPACDWSEHDDI